MDNWKYEPAQDLGLSESERHRSLKREDGLPGFLSRTLWWALVRTYLKLGQRITISGREHLPAAPPFMIVANHASHLDAILLATALPLKLRHHTFPIAAGDTFFETPALSAFAAGCMNALPMWRKNAGRHAMEQLRHRLLADPCAYILFPEGTRSRTGAMTDFKAGVGMLIAGTPAPIIPCHLAGTFHALPAGKKLPRRTHIHIQFGAPLNFHTTPNSREGWNHIAQSLHHAVTALAPKK